MDDDPDAGMLRADILNLAYGELRVHRAVALPQNDARLLDGFRREAAPGVSRFPHDHPIERHAHVVCRCGPGADRAGRARARRAPTPSAAWPRHSRRCRRRRRARRRRLHRRGGIDVGDGGDSRRRGLQRAVGPTSAAPRLPRRRDFVRHVGHRAAGLEIRNHHGLVRPARTSADSAR